MFKRIGLAKMTMHNKKVMVSTVEISKNQYETIVMYENDGEEIELIRTKDLETAKQTHNRLMNKYNDIIYEGSINKLLGFDNYGQFVTPIVAC